MRTERPGQSSSSELRYDDPDWPAKPVAAFQGLAGELVKAIDPHTEADPVAVLVHLLAAFTNAAGRRPHMQVGADVHGARLNAVVVGKSSKARKGGAWAPVRAICKLIDQSWADERVGGGLATGQGLITAVRDPVYKLKDGQQVTVDDGVKDKRLLALEPEFSRLLKVAQRENSILSEIIRHCFDDGHLENRTSSSPQRATGAHVQVVGHITIDELRRELSATEQANGFANRFLWVLARRSKLLAEPEPLTVDGELVDCLRRRLETAKTIDVMYRDTAAKELWTERYRKLSEDREGLVGAVINRAEAQVLRLSMAYALLDGSCVITREHLESAFAFWGYCEDSAVYLFGNASGDPVEDTIAENLERSKELTRNEIYDLFGRHATRERIASALIKLAVKGKADSIKRDTGGRPVEVWVWEGR